MKQTASVISTYSADVMGVCSALFELGGMTVMHDASGCNSTYTTHDEPRWYDMDSMVYISGLSEMEAIMGDDEKLIEDICLAAEELEPAFIAIAGTPIPAMTGFDFEAVAEVIEQRTGIPSFGFATTGMNTYIHGASMALAGIARRFVDKPTPRVTEMTEGVILSEAKDHSEKIKVNILGLTPLDFSINGQDRSIAEWLESEGFEVVSKWAMGSDLDEIRRAGEADINLVVSASGLGAARVLHERFGMPYAVGVPVGNELPGLLADQMILWLRGQVPGPNGTGTCPLSHSEISVESGVFLGGRQSEDGRSYDKGFAAVIGEGVTSLSLASSIELECGIPARVLCATECPEDILRECDRLTPDEDDIIPELEGADFVIADPLYRPIVPEGAKFIALPHEAFSGRIYRSDIPDLIKDPDAIFKQF
ncbi:MAG: oxidoreductase [Clostridiales bacterium]|nr:oxidoreductase [Clostridiales bacterium]